LDIPGDCPAASVFAFPSASARIHGIRFWMPKGNPMTLDELLQLQALRAKAGYDNPLLVDRVLEGAEEGPQVRQMCAKVSPALIDELDEVCARLDLSKRRFIEAAVIEALARAREVLQRTGLNDLQGSL